jgi:hypothetical protein
VSDLGRFRPFLLDGTIKAFPIDKLRGPFFVVEGTICFAGSSPTVVQPLPEARKLGLGPVGWDGCRYVDGCGGGWIDGLLLGTLTKGFVVLLNLDGSLDAYGLRVTGIVDVFGAVIDGCGG